MIPKKCVIIDDEPAAHYVLINYIKQNPQLELVKQCYNGIEALNYLRNNKADLLFLDIDMPEITGLELLRTLQQAPKVILTTAYSEFALESYEYGVIDYLLKPIYFPRFIKSIERFLSMENAAALTQPEPEELVVKVNGEQLVIPLGEILYAQSLGNYVKIFTQQGNYLATITTAQLEKELPASRFVRVHKSYIVSIDKTSGHDKEAVLVRDTRIPVGITYRRELSERLRVK